VQVPLLRRHRHPPALGCKVPNVPSEDERDEQRQEEDGKKSYSQRFPLGSQNTNIGANPRLTAKYCSNTMPAGSELTGSVSMPANYSVLGNLAVREGRFQFSAVENLWKTMPEGHSRQLDIMGMGLAVLNFLAVGFTFCDPF
jgi:hypothetical protein